MPASPAFHSGHNLEFSNFLCNPLLFWSHRYLSLFYFTLFWGGLSCVFAALSVSEVLLIGSLPIFVSLSLSYSLSLFPFPQPCNISSFCNRLMDSRDKGGPSISSSSHMLLWQAHSHGVWVPAHCALNRTIAFVMHNPSLFSLHPLGKIACWLYCYI